MASRQAAAWRPPQSAIAAAAPGRSASSQAAPAIPTINLAKCIRRRPAVLLDIGECDEYGGFAKIATASPTSAERRNYCASDMVASGSAGEAVPRRGRAGDRYRGRHQSGRGAVATCAEIGEESKAAARYGEAARGRRYCAPEASGAISA